MSIIAGLIDLIFPPRKQCPFCSVPQEHSEICGQCLENFYLFRQEPVCFLCGRYFQQGIDSENTLLMDEAILCCDCASEKRFFSFSRAVGPYEDVLKSAVHRFKYSGKKGLAVHFSQIMFQVIAYNPQYLKAQCIVPVPLSHKRYWHRGYNQSELLAYYLAEKMKIEMLPVVRKVKETLPQAGLNRDKRLKNLEDSFSLADNSPIKGKTILLVDDVVTTCTTLNRVSEVLIEGGAATVICIAAAAGRVAHPPSFCSKTLR